ncbi:hypothetical protein [Synechococcus sp. CBW1004]|uniref:hypothetical protein n=1 Tax=Synechococcus sp. CBW1004 TaxID=1353136 RepID=UPI0018CCEB20|nr:hypothetical protein [Synechococcus sp. CBW1004]QPN64318.1 hypothetical protein H8F25_06040 [Synechococcus sp. CBW1004]
MIEALLRKAELIDAQEDARYGKGKRSDELTKELQRHHDRMDALRKAKAELEAEAAADHAHRREQQARAAEEQSAGPAAQAAYAEAAVAGNDNSAARGRLQRRNLPKKRSEQSAGRAVLRDGRSWPASWRSRRPRWQIFQPRIR